MEPCTTAASMIIGLYAVLFGWTAFGGSGRSASNLAAASEAQMRHVQEACEIHERWSDANDIHVACFDLFTILRTEEAIFTRDLELFAVVVGQSMKDESPAGEEKTRVIMRAWDYLNNKDKNDAYTKFLTPLIYKQRESQKLVCAAVPKGRGRAQKRGSGPMGKTCGW